MVFQCNWDIIYVYMFGLTKIWRKKIKVEKWHNFQTQLLRERRPLCPTSWEIMRGSFLHVLCVSLEHPAGTRPSVTLRPNISKTLLWHILASFVENLFHLKMHLAFISQEIIRRKDLMPEVWLILKDKYTKQYFNTSLWF